MTTIIIITTIHDRRRCSRRHDYNNSSSSYNNSHDGFYGPGFDKDGNGVEVDLLEPLYGIAADIQQTVLALAVVITIIA